MAVFLIVAVTRYLFTVPAELGAGWLFRTAPLGPASRVLAGARKAAILVAVMPAVLLVPAVSWTGGRLVASVVVVACLAVLLASVATRGLERVPFSAPCVPGSANIRLTWAPWLIAFAAYLKVARALDGWVAADGIRVPLAVVFTGGLAWALRGAETALVLEEEDEGSWLGGR